MEQMQALVLELQQKLASKPKAQATSAVKVSHMKLCPTKTGKQMLYFTTPSMVAHSETKGKDYQASILLQAHQIEPFLAAIKDGSLVKLAKQFIENKWSETKL
jgi:hypothetical protein